MIRIFSFYFFATLPIFCSAQYGLRWQNVDSVYAPLPSSVHIYFTDQAIDTAPFRAFYIEADLKDKRLDFTTDTTFERRLTPQLFYEKNNHPLLVVNGTFFSFETNRNLNVVVKDGRLLAQGIETIKGKGADSSSAIRVYRGAIGISKKRKADVAWIKTDSTSQSVLASQEPLGRGVFWTTGRGMRGGRYLSSPPLFYNWKMQTAIGGGPVLIQNKKISISNEQEHMFTGKAVNEKHPRTAMGYTKDRRLIILMVEGRNPAAGGATLEQEAKILLELGCVEALNLDGGGSSCLLLNGKETIRPSDKNGQRPVPAVFIVHWKVDNQY